jgi:O-antigen ligase
MTRIRWIGEIAIFALLSVTALYVMAPFHSRVIILLVLVAPVLLLFVFPSAFRAAWSNVVALGHSLTWWHWLILLGLLSSLTFRLRDIEDINSNPLDAAALFRIGVDALVILVLTARLINGRSPWFRQAFRGLPAVLILFSLFAAISTFWSVRPLWTLYKSVEYGFDVALFVAVLISFSSLKDYKRVLDWVWTLIALQVLSAWIGAAIVPRLAFDYGETGSLRIPELTGVIPVLAANAIGQIGAILGIVSLSRLLLRPSSDLNRPWYHLLLGFSLITMFMAQSRSAIGAFLFALMLLLFFSRRVFWGTCVAVSGAIAIVLLGAQKNIGEYLARGQHMEQITGLTGRVDWWSFAWEKFLQKPFTGWGGFAGGRFVVLANFAQGSVPDIHSSIVETLVDTGVIGVFLIVIALLGTWWYLYRGIKSRRLDYTEKSIAIECLAVIAVLTVRSGVSSTLISHPALPFLAVVGYAEFVRRRLKSNGRFSEAN